MTELKDPAIKLFGKTIPLPPKQRVSVSATPGEENCDRVSEEEEDGKTSSESKLTANRKENESSRRTLEELKDPETSCDNPKTPSVGKEPTPPKPSKAGDQSETSISQEKTLKKPDKILPCPRCNSMETKFCYYNNYNVSQPRYFCKKCQRYWTAGGIMRNVPVGSGRRKNKSSFASHYRHIVVSDCLQAARADGTILSFGADSQPFCESIALKPLENFQLVKISFSGGGRREKGDDDTRSSSNSAENGGNRNPVFHQSVAQNLPCFRGPGPWFYPSTSPPWRSGISPPALGPCGFPMPGFPPPPYWGCTTLPGSWNVPWIPPPASSTLGKHLRDTSEKEEPLYVSDSERGVWTPKTLRLDLNEAAKSSIWSNLGIKNEKNDSTNAGGCLFKALHSKGEEKTQAEGTYLALQANPAALSRSFKFRESVNEC
ncbi:hypothetical protein RHMOL_Rhmol12G0069800 [Rhododendron molle]|uniref:Uncharacterized protein n=1 Tax=Rhododendron molle TaxID=49168 RepID=A0ACC0LFJ6_RHOML|nr:hypothetical protein RHMOL_Rhmol12G0069800 [Rhododendron molle]